MFEKLRDSDGYWKRMVRQYSISVRKSNQPRRLLFGWELWSCDGKAYLFRGTECRRCDWFDLCHTLRALGLSAY